jgi:hypothetical protein
MPLLESDEESMSGRLASQLLRRVSEDRGEAGNRGRTSANDSVIGAHMRNSDDHGSGAGGWLPLPQFWPHSGEAADGGPGRADAASSGTSLRPVPPAWRTVNLTGFAASGLRSHPIVEQRGEAPRPSDHGSQQSPQVRAVEPRHEPRLQRKLRPFWPSHPAVSDPPANDKPSRFVCAARRFWRGR